MSSQPNYLTPWTSGSLSFRNSMDLSQTNTSSFFITSRLLATHNGKKKPPIFLWSSLFSRFLFSAAVAKALHIRIMGFLLATEEVFRCREYLLQVFSRVANMSWESPESAQQVLNLFPMSKFQSKAHFSTQRYG